MLHVDIPTRADIEALFAVRSPACVSIYLRTTPITHEAQQDRIELRNLAKSALDQLVSNNTPKKLRDALEESIGHLIEDDEFWKYQANSLAVLATPDRILTFRLATHVGPLVEVSDRFHLKPLLRSITFPQSAYVLALSQHAVRLVEVTPGLPPAVLKVHGMPECAPSAAGRSSLVSRGPLGTLQGEHAKDIWLTQFARQIDAALRPILAGSDIPLILAATEPLLSIYRSVNTYVKLADHAIEGNPDKTPNHDLDKAARPILDLLYKADLARIHDEFAARTPQSRTSTDLAQIARAATYGVVSTLLVDIDEIVHGTLDDDGKVTLADKPGPNSYGVVDQIAARALATGARVLGVRRDDIPGKHSLAAIFRYKF